MKLTTKIKTKIILLYDKNISISDISKITNVSTASIYKILKDANVYKKLEYKLDLLKKQIYDLYNSGESVKNISNKLSISISHIRNILKKLNIFKSNNIKLTEMLLNICETLMIPLYQNGKSLTEILKILHIDRHTISKWLKKYNIEVINPTLITKFNEHIFDTIDTEEKAYWLGFIFADGSISSTNYTFELSLKEGDLEHLTKFNKFMLYNGNNISQKKIKLNNKLFIAYKWNIHNKHLWHTLFNYKCVPKKSLILLFPDINIFKYPKLISDFIRGYFDGDGCISYCYRKLYIKATYSLIGTYEFLTECKNILLLNNIQCNILTKDKRRNSNTYILHIKAKSTDIFYNYIYNNSTISLERKYKRAVMLYNKCTYEQLKTIKY